MDEGIANLATHERKDPRHLEPVTQLRADTMAVEHPGGKASHPGRKAEKLSKSTFGKAKRCVIVARRVAYMDGAFQAKFLKILISNLVARHVDKHDSGAFFFDGSSFFGNISQCFSAKCTTKMPEKDE